jgi:hypothetical protein
MREYCLFKTLRSDHFPPLSTQVATLGVPIFVERGTQLLDYINSMHSVKRSEVWYGKHISQEI